MSYHVMRKKQEEGNERLVASQDSLILKTGGGDREVQNCGQGQGQGQRARLWGKKKGRAGLCCDLLIMLSCV